MGHPESYCFGPDQYFRGRGVCQTTLLIEHPEQQNDREAEYEAGAAGALRIYETLLKANAKDRQPYRDELLRRRDAGTLDDFVKQRVTAARENRCKRKS
jgi:hypothetical protein